AWRYLLISPAIFAIITLLLRLGSPESARWLLSRGRKVEARKVVKKVYGEQYELEDLGESLEDDAPKAKLRTVFQGRYLKRTAFVAIFWTMQVIPMFAVYTFAPELLESFGL